MLTNLTALAPRLGHAPLSLGTFPTPVEPMERLILPGSRKAWVKREDRSHPVYGGNKVRKLQWLLPDILARGGTMVTLGAAGSHHVIASAVLGAQAGVKVHGVLVPQPDSDHVRENLRLSLGLAHRIWPCRSTLDVLRQVFRAWRYSRREDGVSPVWIGPGGSSPLGCLGWVEAALEIGDQIRQQQLPEPTDLVVPAGSCGTVAGLHAGLALAGLENTRLHGVRVTEKWMANGRSIRRLAMRTRALLVRGGAEVPRLRPEQLQVHHDFCGVGYGHDTEAGCAARGIARDQAGLVLEPTYTAKAFAGLMSLCEREVLGPRVLFVNTLSSAPLGDLLARAPSQVPAEFLGLLQAVP